MYIVVDIGGTKMRIAGSHDLSNFDEPIVLDTPKEYREGLARITETVHMIAAGQSIVNMAIGIAGTLSHDKRSLVHSRNLGDWVSHALVHDLERKLSTTTHMENDTALVGLGEVVFGAGKGSEIAVYVTVSTGVNGVRIVNNKIDQSTHGFEIGGQYLFTGEHLETLEELVSGRSIEEKYGKPPRDLGKEWPGWDDLAVITAVGIHNTILHWSPDRVICGGSMFNEIGISVDRVWEHTSRIMEKFPKVPAFVHAQLQDRGGLYGGLALLKQHP